MGQLGKQPERSSSPPPPPSSLLSPLLCRDCQMIKSPSSFPVLPSHTPRLHFPDSLAVRCRCGINSDWLRSRHHDGIRQARVFLGGGAFRPQEGLIPVGINLRERKTEEGKPQPASHLQESFYQANRRSSLPARVAHWRNPWSFQNGPG